FTLWAHFSFISGDGSRVAALNLENNMLAEDWFALRLLDTETGNLLATIPFVNGGVDINEDGTVIAFDSTYDYTGQNSDHNLELFLWNNGVYTQITNNQNIYPPHSSNALYEFMIFPRISGGGRTVVFSMEGNLTTDAFTNN